MIAAVASIISLFILYFIIKGAVEAVAEKKVEPYLRAMYEIIKLQAGKDGISQEDIDRVLLKDKEFKKKYKREKKDAQP